MTINSRGVGYTVICFYFIYLIGILHNIEEYFIYMTVARFVVEENQGWSLADLPTSLDDLSHFSADIK